MKIEIHVFNIKDRLNEPVERYLEYFSHERQQAIMRYKFLPDRNRTVFAELMAKKLISDMTGKTFHEIAIFRDSNGKPFSDIKGIYFSLSHSGEWIACSIGDTINGVDVESAYRKIDIKIAEKFFLPDEYKTIKNLSETGQDWRQKFFHYWTLKESCLKCLSLREWSHVDCEKLLHGNDFIGGCNFDLPEGTVLGCCAHREFLPECFCYNDFKF